MWWCQHHNGIFRSTDDLASWHEITGVKPSVFGFPVVVDPFDGDTAWFIPAIKDEKRIPVDGRLVVNRTRDGGKTFETPTAAIRGRRYRTISHPFTPSRSRRLGEIMVV